MIPGEVLVGDGELELNAGRKTVQINVSNTGDRPIQVGSHFHFFETNDALSFDRAKARGYRLNIAAGTAVRFEPGQQREVELVALAGDRIVYGFNGQVMGPLDALPPTPALPRKRGRESEGRKPAHSVKSTASPAKRGAEAGFREATASRRRSDVRPPARGFAGAGAARARSPSRPTAQKKGGRK